MIVLASRNFSSKSKIFNSLFSHILKHIPCLIKTIKRSIYINMQNISTRTIFAKSRSNFYTLLNRGFNTQTYPLIRKQRQIFVYFVRIEHFICLRKFNCRRFPWNCFKINFIIFIFFKFGFNGMDGLKNFLAKIISLLLINNITKLICISISKSGHCFINSHNANTGITMVKIYQPMRKIGKQPLLHIASNNSTLTVKHF